MKLSLFGGLAASALAAALLAVTPASAGVVVTLGSSSSLNAFTTHFDSLVSQTSNTYTDLGMKFTAESNDPTQGITATTASATNPSLTPSNHRGQIHISLVDGSIAFTDLNLQFANFVGGTQKLFYRIEDFGTFVGAGSFSSFSSGPFRLIDLAATSGTHFTDVWFSEKSVPDPDSPGPAGFNNITIDNAGGSTVFAHVVSSVPEPSTWALMLLGFGTMGAMLRNQRRTLQTASA